MEVDLPAGLAARAHRAIEPLHALIYFVPEIEQELTAVGLRPGRMCYFASRSAPMGPVSAGVATATFYNFNPSLVAHFIPRAWTLASPDTIVAARFAAADLALRRLLGSDVIESDELTEAAGLAREATTALRPEGRPLYAGHADLDWPDESHLVLFHAATLLREYRGDGHIAALLGAGLSGLEAIVTHTATGNGFTEGAAKLLRGWSEEQWGAAVADLRTRGLLDGSGLTPAGKELRERIEDDTDRMDTASWQHIGVQRTERLIELGKALSRIVVANGAFPPGVFARRG
jgi:hypothetical protein